MAAATGEGGDRWGQGPGASACPSRRCSGGLASKGPGGCGRSPRRQSGEGGVGGTLRARSGLLSSGETHPAQRARHRSGGRVRTLLAGRCGGQSRGCALRAAAGAAFPLVTARPPGPSSHLAPARPPQASLRRGNGETARRGPSPSGPARPGPLHTGYGLRVPEAAVGEPAGAQEPPPSGDHQARGLLIPARPRPGPARGPLACWELGTRAAARARGESPPPPRRLTGPRCVLTVVAMVLGRRASPAENRHAGDLPSGACVAANGCPSEAAAAGQLTAAPPPRRALRRRRAAPPLPAPRAHPRALPAGACAVAPPPPPAAWLRSGLPGPGLRLSRSLGRGARPPGPPGGTVWPQNQLAMALRCLDETLNCFSEITKTPSDAPEAAPRRDL